MANLRKNHASSSKESSGMVVKLGIFAVVAGGLFYVFNLFSGKDVSLAETIEKASEVINQGTNDGDSANSSGNNAYDTKTYVDEALLPTSTTGQIVKHGYYALSYSEDHEQPEWVAYELSKDLLYKKRVDRSNNFRPDPKVSSASASPRDYKRSGYDRGHLVPAGDMGFSKRSMSETFYMSNMSPQIRNFNGGVWRELEEQTRDWVMKFDKLYIVTGPVLTAAIRDKIGVNEVSVPDSYYKVLLDLSEPEVKAIGFILPNEIRYEHLSQFAVSVDEVEELTGIDFFYRLMDENLEKELEAKVDIDQWKFSKKRFEQRVKSWNKRK
ncbi:MAG: DNA/RNA non-specific endonuclease [Saprospiraceae bacterium]